MIENFAFVLAHSQRSGDQCFTAAFEFFATIALGNINVGQKIATAFPPSTPTI